MPRPRPKGGSVAAPQQQGPNHAQPLEQAFIVKVMIGDKGPFGFPFEDTRQPVSSILNLIQRFLESMQGVFSLEVGENPTVDALRTQQGNLLNPADIIEDVLSSGATVYPVFADVGLPGLQEPGEDVHEEEDGEAGSLRGPESMGRGRRSQRQPRKDVGVLVNQMQQASMVERRAPSPSATLAAFSEEPSCTMPGHEGRVFDVAFAPGGARWLASAGEDDCGLVWELDPATRQYELAAVLGGSPETGHSDAVLRINWSPDGLLLATGSSDGSVCLWKGPQAEENDVPPPLITITNHPEEVYACEFVAGAQPGYQMVTASSSSLFLWDLQTQACLYQTPDLPLSPEQLGGVPERWQEAHIFTARQQPEGRLFAAGCSDGALRLYALENASLRGLVAVPLHEQGCTACTWHPGGSLVASASRDGSILILDVRRLELPVWQTRSRGPVFGCTWVPGPTPVLAACGVNNAVALMDITLPENDGTNGADVPPPRAPTNRIIFAEGPPRMMLCVCASDDGSCIAASGDLVGGGENCLDPCCMPPPPQEDEEDEAAAEDDDDGMFAAPVKARGGRMVLTAPPPQAEAPPLAPPRQPWAPINLWRARAAVLNGIA